MVDNNESLIKALQNTVAELTIAQQQLATLANQNKSRIEGLESRTTNIEDLCEQTYNAVYEGNENPVFLKGTLSGGGYINPEKRTKRIKELKLCL